MSPYFPPPSQGSGSGRASTVRVVSPLSGIGSQASPVRFNLSRAFRIINNALDLSVANEEAIAAIQDKVNSFDYNIDKARFDSRLTDLDNTKVTDQELNDAIAIINRALDGKLGADALDAEMQARIAQDTYLDEHKVNILDFNAEKTRLENQETRLTNRLEILAQTVDAIQRGTEPPTTFDDISISPPGISHVNEIRDFDFQIHFNNLDVVPDNVDRLQIALLGNIIHDQAWSKSDVGSDIIHANISTVEADNIINNLQGRESTQINAQYLVGNDIAFIQFTHFLFGDTFRALVTQFTHGDKEKLDSLTPLRVQFNSEIAKVEYNDLTLHTIASIKITPSALTNRIMLNGLAEVAAINPTNQSNVQLSYELHRKLGNAASRSIYAYTPVIRGRGAGSTPAETILPIFTVDQPNTLEEVTYELQIAKTGGPNYSVEKRQLTAFESL